MMLYVSVVLCGCVCVGGWVWVCRVAVTGNIRWTHNQFTYQWWKTECAPVHKCSTGYDLEGASSKLMMLDSGCWGPPAVGAPAPCDSEDAPAPPAGLGAEDEAEEEEGSRPPGRSGCVSVRTSSSSSSSSSSMLGQADWSSTRFRRSFRALRASCLEGRADGWARG